MQKLFDAAVDYPLAGIAANEEFQRPIVPIVSPDHAATPCGWNAYEIWRSRIRLLPGVTSLFLAQR
jgi:hypothetical protein